MQIATELIQCPICAVRRLNRKLLSANSRGARYYTDGYIFPGYPLFVKCPDCGAVFKAADYDVSGETGEGVEYYTPMTVKEYRKAIEKGFANAADGDIIALRLELWRTFHNPVRDADAGERATPWKGAKEKAAYTGNCLELLRLTENCQDDEVLLTRAELYRNLGEFDKCKQTLSLITQSDDYESFIAGLLEACAKRKKRTFRL